MVRRCLSLWAASWLLGGCGTSSGTAAAEGHGSSSPSSSAGASSSASPSTAALRDASVADATSDARASKGADAAPDGSTACTGTAQTSTTPPLTIPCGFKLEVIATLTSPREIAALPNGDLIVGSSGNSVYLVPNAEGVAAGAGAHSVFASVNDGPVNGVAFDSASSTLFIASRHGIYAVKYTAGQQTATLGTPIAQVRQGPVSPTRGGDTDEHTTTSVAVADGKLYAGVGSSCNACVETDPTRATVQVMNLDGSGMTTRATRIRNAIALAANPATGSLWAGGAGQDDIATGHPYEFFDPVTSHPGTADYGWPDCEENHMSYGTAGCSNTVEPQVELPAYSTIIGATFYPASTSGSYAFPAMYAGGLFLSVHGSWHMVVNTNDFFSPPRVVFVPMTGDIPNKPVNWADVTAAPQWSDFITGFQPPPGDKQLGRSTGIAVGAQGSLFVADDSTGNLYRVRPN